jgi:hypothetical protein
MSEKETANIIANFAFNNIQKKKGRNLFQKYLKKKSSRNNFENFGIRSMQNMAMKVILH